VVKNLAVIVAHPLRKVSGATNAGLQLSAATAKLVDLEVAIMWDADGTEKTGELTTHYVRCHNRLGPLERLAPRAVRVPLYDSTIPRLIRRGAWDIVHLHNLFPTLAAQRVATACRQAGIPYVISSHGFVELSTYAAINRFGPVKSFLIDFLITRPFHRIVAGAERIFALSECEHRLLHTMGVEPSRIDVVTNGINEFYLEPPAPAELTSIRERFVQNEGPVLLFMGSLHAYKGLDTFLASLKLRNDSFQAIVAGRFKHAHEPRRLMDRARLPTALRRRITFTGGVTNEELRALYHCADVFVYPTDGDTLPLVVLEAMACARPVVSTTVGGIPCAVTPDCGILVPPSDPAGITQAVTTLLASPDLRRSMGAAGRARVAKVFRWEKAAQAAVAGYKRVLSREAPRESVAAGCDASPAQ
jgi:starch synthase